eukprot:685156-Amphidinium_carterae.1
MRGHLQCHAKPKLHYTLLLLGSDSKTKTKHFHGAHPEILHERLHHQSVSAVCHGGAGAAKSDHSLTSPLYPAVSQIYDRDDKARYARDHGSGAGRCIAVLADMGTGSTTRTKEACALHGSLDLRTVTHVQDRPPCERDCCQTPPKIGIAICI